MIADDADLIKAIREKTFAKGVIATEATDPEEKTVYDMYYGSAEAIAKMPNHRVLAVNRGEKEKKLKVKVNMDSEEIQKLIDESYNRESLDNWTEISEGLFKYREQFKNGEIDIDRTV
jgi:uncharacterized protein